MSPTRVQACVQRLQPNEQRACLQHAHDPAFLELLRGMLSDYGESVSEADALTAAFAAWARSRAH
jgi:hypothetical protein